MSKEKTFFFRATLTLKPASIGLSRSMLTAAFTFLPATATIGYGSIWTFTFWKYSDVAGLQISKGTFDWTSGYCCCEAVALFFALFVALFVALPPTFNCRNTERLRGYELKTE